MKRLSGIGTILLACCIVSIVGCEKPVDAELLKLRDATLLQVEPESFVTIDAAQKSVKDGAQITVEGCVDLAASDSKPGMKKAVFLIRKILPNDHGGSSHDPSTCPFCKKRLAAAPKAAVAFVDETGKALPYDPETLLGIEQGDLVVVSGKAKYDKDLELLQIKAGKLFIRDKNTPARKVTKAAPSNSENSSPEKTETSATEDGQASTGDDS